MTLPAGGLITLAHIAAEYDLPVTTPFPAGYYGKPGFPASGAVSFFDLYGKSHVLFSPNGGNVATSTLLNASLALSCNQPAIWTYTGGGAGGTASIASGASATSVTFSVTAGGTGGNRVTRTVQWTVEGRCQGVVRNFLVTVAAEGNQ